MSITPDKQMDELLGILFIELQRILGERLIGLYLYGSFAGGDFDFEISDIDLLAVTETEIDEKEFDEIREMQNEFVKSNHRWKDRLEIAYLSRHALKTFKTETSRAAIISPGEPFHIKNAGRHWLIDWHFVREKGVTLFGPPPTTLIAPISKKEFIEMVREYAQTYGEWADQSQSRGAQSYAVLTLCRSLCAVETGEQVSKKQAALWAQKRFPQWTSLIQNALEWRMKSKSDEEITHPDTMPETSRFVQFAIKQMASDHSRSKT